MSGLWTPSGEHYVPRQPEEPTAPAGGPGGVEGPPGAGGTPPGAGGTPPGRRPDAGRRGGGHDEEGDDGEDLEELRRRLVATPAATIVANHAYGLFELAALHLSNDPPDLEAARLAIDSMAALLDGVGPRLAEHSAPLADGLAQIRLAFVRIADAKPATDGSPQTAGA